MGSEMPFQSNYWIAMFGLWHAAIPSRIHARQVFGGHSVQLYACHPAALPASLRHRGTATQGGDTKAMEACAGRTNHDYRNVHYCPRLDDSKKHFTYLNHIY